MRATDGAELPGSTTGHGPPLVTYFDPDRWTVGSHSWGAAGAGELGLDAVDASGAHLALCYALEHVDRVTGLPSWAVDSLVAALPDVQRVFQASATSPGSRLPRPCAMFSALASHASKPRFAAIRALGSLWSCQGAARRCCCRVTR